MLLDTSGLLCLFHKDELLHEKACAFYRAAQIRITNNYVLAEFIALATVRRLPRKLVLSFVVDLLNNPDVRVIWVEESLNAKAMSLLLHRQDKTYSLCDAVSFLLMRQNGVEDALTTDHHFEQEGFRRLLL